MSQQNTKGVPNWATFLFAGSLLVGALFAVYYHGFLGLDSELALRQDKRLSFEAPATPGIDLAAAPARNAAAISKGEAAYNTTCAACHGANLEGGVGPGLADAEWWHAPNAAETEIANVIWTGVSGAKQKSAAPMPAKGGNSSLTAANVFEIVYYISSKNPGIKKDAL